MLSTTERRTQTLSSEENGSEKQSKTQEELQAMLCLSMVTIRDYHKVSFSYIIFFYRAFTRQFCDLWW